MTCAGCAIVGGETREHESAAEGWSRRSITAVMPSRELTALYRSIGLEVHLESIDVDVLDPACTACASDLVTCRVIYTRPPSRAVADTGWLGREP